MWRTFFISFVCAVLTACGGHLAPRDADGNPQLQRLDNAALSQPANRAPQQLRLEDIASMSQAGRSSAEIITRMRETGTRLAMDENQQQVLRRHGVPEGTIEAMIAAEHEAKRIDKLTAEADRAATQKRQEEARRDWYRSYDPYPYYGPFGGWHPYFGYSRFGHSHGWHSGIGWGW